MEGLQADLCQPRRRMSAERRMLLGLLCPLPVPRQGFPAWLHMPGAAQLQRETPQIPACREGRPWSCVPRNMCSGKAPRVIAVC